MGRLVLQPEIGCSPYARRLQKLDQLLVATAPLWQPHPFKTERPAWCETHPELTRALLGLDEAALAHYSSDNEALIRFIAGFIPQLAAIPSLIALPATEHKQRDEPAPHLGTGVPGRKWQQIRSLYHAMDEPQHAITEWCGGKGYLGRLLSMQWQQPVTTPEYNRLLVDAGRALADKFSANQQFQLVDVLHDQPGNYVRDKHTIALHACGDLHRELISQIIRYHPPRFTIVPCCYHLGRDTAYTPFNRGLTLQLSTEALRMAVNETVTAHHNEITKRNQDMAWKLGFQKLRERLTGNSDYYSFRPVPKAWLQEGFKLYCQKLCEREQLPLPTAVDWHAWESCGYKRRHDVMRLQLLRHCFKRVLELWLIMDMAVYLQERDYMVSVGVFCDKTLTPRNIMIEGRALPLSGYNGATK